MRATKRGSDLDPVLKFLTGRTGLTCPASRRRDFERGINNIMAKYGITSAGHLISRLSADRAAFDALITEVTVGETYFFRDPVQFDAIRDTVLPELLRSRPSDAPIRVWSAGCATGEEPYSTAILMEEEGLGQRATVLGTDISSSALKKARKAEYGTWSFRNEKRKPVASYFTRNGGRFQLAERIRSRVQFKILNLASDDYPSPQNGTEGVDLILCRNVLIYLDRKSIRHVAQRFLTSLNEGGWLITGPSDPPLWEYGNFTTVITPGGVFYRRGVQATPIEPAKHKPEPASLPNPPAAMGRQPRQRMVVPTPTVKQEPAATADRRLAGRGLKAGSSVDAAALEIRSLANAGSLNSAEKSAAEAIARHPLSPELHFLHGMILIALERQDEAQTALRRVIYLDRSLAAAHLALGSLLQRTGEHAAARRAFATAQRLCAARPASEPVPLTDGDMAGRLAQSAEAQIRILDDRIQAES